MKKLLSLSLGLAAVAFLLYTGTAKAATPTLSVSATGSGDYVQIDVTGDAGYPVLMSYSKSTGGNWLQSLGTVASNGSFSTQISTATYNISPNSTIYVTVNNQQSATVTWPYNSNTSGSAITFSQTGTVTTVGQTTTLTVNNLGNNTLYLLNNTNPQVANVNIGTNSSQVTVYANTYGQTVATVCVLGTTTNCASDYITVQNVGATALTFTQSNLTVAHGQSVQVTILNGTTGASGTGNYTIVNNSNPGVISATLSNAVITLTAAGNNGAASLTVCTTDMSSCGIINASAGNVSSSGLTFSQSAPTMTVGQTVNVTLSGGTTYSVSSNSNSNVVVASINNTNNLQLVGNAAGSAVVTVCSSAGNCGSLTATVNYATTGPISLSQSSIWLQVGQAVSVVVSGGTMPYSLLNTASSSSFVQATLNNNIVTLTGIAPGSSSVSVCSSGGACVQLAYLVNGTASTGQLTFSNNNLSLLVGNTATVTLYGNGGYYISNTTNQNVATIALSGNQVTITPLTAGSANASICQTGGQCSVLYVSVTSTTPNATPPVLTPANPTVAVGQTTNVTVTGGVSSNYYVSSNSNPTIVQALMSGGHLALTGLQAGSAVISVCAASNNCTSLSVTVTNAVPASNNSNNSGNNSGNNSNSNSQSNTSGDTTLNAIANESSLLMNGNLSAILSAAGAVRDAALESADLTKYVKPLLAGLSLTTAQTNNLTYFIAYGTVSTKKLGAGERAGVLSSYKQAYNKLPEALAEWSDLLKISVGRWPGETSAAAITQAKSEFVKVYNRQANMAKANDSNAITIIAYGLRPTARNTKSEQAAILSFRSVYGHYPVNPLAWNIVRAIAYSGATR